MRKRIMQLCLRHEKLLIKLFSFIEVILNRSKAEKVRRLVSILNQRALLLSASAFTSDCQAGCTMRMDDLLTELSPAERKKVVIIDPNREFELLEKHFNFGGDRDAD